jgi:hypothetical protein
MKLNYQIPCQLTEIFGKSMTFLSNTQIFSNFFFALFRISLYINEINFKKNYQFVI